MSSSSFAQNWNFPLNGAVSALRLAQNGKVLVGAGSDAYVFDCQNPTAPPVTLEGLASPIASLAADKTCARVVAGTDGGSLRLWDVESRQTIRTFANAHRASITSVEYHSFGEFIATASRDTHVRIWDTRKKSCLQVYKAPGAGFMEVVRFSPDGRWAVSGCSNGVLRICDLMGGTLLHELPSNNAPIVSISFHPTRCNIAVAGANGSLTIWDAEKFQKVFTTSNPGHSVCDFSERYLAWGGSSGKITKLAASDWSPRDSITDGTWKDQLDDIRCEEGGTVFAAKKSITGVSVTMFKSASGKPSSNNTSPLPAKQKVTPSRTGNNNNNDENTNNAVRYNHQFTSNRHPVASKAVNANNNNDATKAPRSSSSGATNALQQRREQQRIRRNQQQQQQQQADSSATEDDDLTTSDSDDVANPPQQRRYSSNNGGAVPPSHQQSNNNSPHTLQAPISSSAPAAKSDDQMLDEALQRSDNMSALIQRRLTNTRVFRTLWQQHPDRALVHLEQTLSTDTNDCGTTIDFFLTLHHQRVKEKIQIEHAPILLRLVQIVLQNHRIEPFIIASMQAARYVNSKFRARIEETLRGASHAAPGVDLSMETRLEKARTCYRLMMEVRTVISQYVARTDAVGEEARALARDLPAAS